MRPCDHAPMRPCDHATMRPCDHAIMRPCDHATMRSCDHATMRPSNHPTMQPKPPATVQRHHHVSVSNRRVLWGLHGPAQADPPVPVTTEMKVSFALDIANGMAFIAEHNFIHRDLASRNVVLDGNMVRATPSSCHPFLVPPCLPCHPFLVPPTCLTRD
jgi:hypothetical protein